MGILEVTFIPAFDPDGVLHVEYNRNPKQFKVPIVMDSALPQATHSVKVDLGDDPPLTRHQRRAARITLVGVRYSADRIGRNEYVSVDGGPRVKFKRTGLYREARR